MSQIKTTDSEPDPDRVKFLGAGYAAEKAYIMVQYTAPPSVVSGWFAGKVYVVDEANGTVYKDVPVVPVVGPLFSRPQEEGQIASVMLYNYGYQINTGSVVTVVWGNCKREHFVMP